VKIKFIKDVPRGEGLLKI